MARIPTLELPRGPRAAPTPNAPSMPSSGYGELTKGVDRLAAGAERFSERVRQEHARASAFRVDRADLLAGQAVNEALHHQQTGFLNQLGENALDNAPVLEALQKRLEQIASTELSDDDQREHFSLRAMGRFEQAKTATEKHTADQRLNVYGGVADGHVKLALDTASVATSKEEVDSAVGKALVGPDGAPGPLRRYLLARGLPAEKVQAEEAAFRAQANGRALESILKKPNGRAAGEAFFAKAKGQLGAREADFKHTLDGMAREEEADVLAQQVLEFSRRNDGKAVEDVALNALDELVTDKELLKEARARASARYAADERAWNEDTERVSSEVYSTVNSLGWWRTPKVLKDRLNERNPRLYDALEDKAMSAARQRRAERAQPTKEQERALTQFLVDAADHPEKYATMPEDKFFSEVSSRLADSDRERAGTVLAALHGKASKPEEFGPSETKLLLQVGRDSGVFPLKQNDVSKWSEEQASVYYRAVEELSSRATAVKKDTGKPPTLEEMKGWADELFLKGEVPGSGMVFDDSTTRIQAELEGKEFEFDVDAVPAEERRHIEEALRAKGRKPTDEDVVRMYRKAHGLPVAPIKAQQPTAPPPRPTPFSGPKY